MSRKCNIIKGFVFSGMLASALPSGAVSYDSSWVATRYNSAGETWIVLPPHGNHFCFLTKVGSNDTDTGGEWATCKIYRSGTVWILGAELSSSRDADVRCSAVCYNN